MVFQTVALFIRSRGPDEFWRKRKIFRLSAHFRGRSRNCYSIAIRNVHRALVFATQGRKLKKEDMKILWDTRITAACEEHNFTYPLLQEGLSRCNVLLNRKSLADLAAWEPRTFEALTNLAWKRVAQDGLAGVSDIGDPQKGYHQGHAEVADTCVVKQGLNSHQLKRRTRVKNDCYSYQEFANVEDLFVINLKTVFA